MALAIAILPCVTLPYWRELLEFGLVVAAEETRLLVLFVRVFLHLMRGRRRRKGPERG